MGKAKMLENGSVTISQEAFIAALRMGRSKARQRAYRDLTAPPARCHTAEIVKLRERWVHGASVCAYLGFVGLIALGVTALCAAAWIYPCEWIFGEFSNEAVRDGLVATAIVVVPIFVSTAMKHIPTPDD